MLRKYRSARADFGQIATRTAWTQLAAASALTSMLGIALFSGIWPGAPTRKLSKIDTIIALAIDAAILILLVAGWLPGTLFGG
jgi:hypothetical protein